MKNFSDPPFATGVTTIAVAVLVVVARSYGLWSWEQLSYDLWRRLRPKQQHARHKDSAIGMNASGSERVHGTVQGVLGTIGGTPLVRVVSLSVATGCEIYGKCEFLNPGGSVKDRVAASIVGEALQTAKLAQGGLVTEGTSGSTGISLAMVARAHGVRCYVALPDDAAEEKAQLLEVLGADVDRVRPVSITHKDHFVNKARRTADAASGVFADQFENLANLKAHYEGTAPELWAQTGGKIHAFLAGSGTGGTIAGVSKYFKVVLWRIGVQGRRIVGFAGHDWCFMTPSRVASVKFQSYDGTATDDLGPCRIMRDS